MLQTSTTLLAGETAGESCRDQPAQPEAEAGTTYDSRARMLFLPAPGYATPCFSICWPVFILLLRSRLRKPKQVLGGFQFPICGMSPVKANVASPYMAVNCRFYRRCNPSER